MCCERGVKPVIKLVDLTRVRAGQVFGQISHAVPVGIQGGVGRGVH